MQPCSVCGHASVREINAALIARVADREVERRFPDVTRASLSRHRRNHLGVVDETSAAVENAVLPAAPKTPVTSVTSDQPVTEQIKAVCADLRQLISSARRKGNLGVANQGLKNLTAALETLGKLTGELAAGTQVAVGVNVSVRAAWEGCDPAVLRWALARHVRAMLTFEPAALNNLELLSAGPCPQCQRYGCPHDHL